MASGFLGFLGKKKEADATAGPPRPVVVRGPGSSPPPGAPPPPASHSGVIPGGTIRPPGSQPLFERARKRVTQRLSLAGLNSGAGGAPKIKIPAALPASPPSEPPPTALVQAEAYLDLPASVLIPLLPEAVLLGDPQTLLASPQGQSDFRLPLGAVLPMLPSGKVEFSIADLSQCAPEGILHPAESLGEWGEQSILLPLPQIVMRVPPEFLSLRRDQKPIDSTVSTMVDPFSPEAIRAKVEAAQAAQAAQAAAQDSEQAAVAPAEVPEESTQPEPEPEIPAPLAEEAPPELEPAVLEAPVVPVVETTTPSAAFAAPETAPEPPVNPMDQEALAALAALASAEMEGSPPEVSSTDPDPAVEAKSDESDLSFTQTEEYRNLLSKLNDVADAPALPPLEPVAEAEAAPPEPGAQASGTTSDSEGDFVPPLEAPKPKPTPGFHFGARPSAPVPVPEVEDAPPASSPLAAAMTGSPGLSGAFSKALHGSSAKPVEASSAPKSDLHHLIRLPEGVPAGFREFTRQLSLWPGVHSCVLCGSDGLPIASAGAEGKSGDALAAVAPRLFKTAAGLFTDLGRTELAEMNFPGDPDSLTFFRRSGFILILAHDEGQLPRVYRKKIHEALALLAQSGPG